MIVHCVIEFLSCQLAHAPEQSPEEQKPQSPMSADEPLSESPPSANDANDASGDPNVIYQQVKYLRRSIHEVNALLEKDEDGNVLDDSPIPSIPTSVSLTVSASEMSDNDDIEYVDKTPESPDKAIIPFDAKGQDVYTLSEPAQASEFPVDTEQVLEPEGAALPEPIPFPETPLPEEPPQEMVSEPEVPTPLPERIPSPVEPPASISPPSERVSVVEEASTVEEAVLMQPILETVVPSESPEEVELRPPRQGNGPEDARSGDRTSVRELLSRFETAPMDADSQFSPGSPPQSASRRSDPSAGERRAKSDSTRSRSTALSSSLDEDRFLSAGAPPRTLLLRTQTEPDVTSTPSESKGAALLESTCQSLALEDDPQRRERIERYKEERRSFLRKKYRSESFRDEKDETLTRLKQKAVPKSVAEDQTVRKVTRTVVATTASQPRRIPSARSPLSEDAPLEKPPIAETLTQSKRPPHRSSLPSAPTQSDSSGSGNRRLSVGNKRAG